MKEPSALNSISGMVTAIRSQKMSLGSDGDTHGFGQDVVVREFEEVLDDVKRELGSLVGRVRGNQRTAGQEKHQQNRILHGHSPGND
jgi:hypothetical protein